MIAAFITFVKFEAQQGRVVRSDFRGNPMFALKRMKFDLQGLSPGGVWIIGWRVKWWRVNPGPTDSRRVGETDPRSRWTKVK